MYSSFSTHLVRPIKTKTPDNQVIIRGFSYPDPVSNLNAALTAIDAGRLESARRYLAKTSDSAERTLAEAAIAMLENRLDEAEALLGKLSGDPSVASQVEENLRQIAAKREELAD